MLSIVIKKIIKNIELKDEKYRDAIIDEDSAKRAFDIIQKEEYNDINQCAIYFSSLNLINSYCKKDYASNEFKNNYYFKKFVQIAVNKLKDSNIEGVEVCINQSVAYVDILGLQFSFHSIKNENYFNCDAKWKGLRLQEYALYIFNSIWNEVMENE